MPKILVVIHVPGRREAVACILSETGHDVAVASCIKKMVEIARGDRPDLVLLDVSTQPQDGFDALLELRTDPATADIPVVLLAGTAVGDGEQRAIDLGANHYLTMPWRLEMLQATIKVALSEPVVAVSQLEPRQPAFRLHWHTKKRPQRAVRRADAPKARREERLPRAGGGKASGPTGLSWQALVKSCITDRYGDRYGAIQNIKFHRITESGPFRGLNIYKLEGLTTVRVGDIPTLLPKGFNVTVKVTRDGKIVDRQGRIL